MSWMEQLVQTYDENERFVGDMDVQTSKSVSKKKPILAPIGHMIVNAQITITLDHDGNLIKAEVVPKEEAETLIPCTLDSASRTSKPMPHPLHDNLQYVARDYTSYAEQKKKRGGSESQYELYKTALEDWVSSEYCHPKIKAVYQYIANHDVIHDLIVCKILFQDESGGIAKKRPKKSGAAFGLFDVAAGDVLKSFVRFDVHTPNEQDISLWDDKEVQACYTRFFQTRGKGSSQLCYATGETRKITEKHSKYIRFPGDGAKLISSNDSSGYTYRGRFSTGTECATISMDASQKAMNVLRWLIRNQGYINSKKVFLTWGRMGIIPPNPMEATSSLAWRGHNKSNSENSAIPKTMQAWADALCKALDGYRHEFRKAKTAQVNLMVLDAATSGRMSICYYSEMAANDFLDRIEIWHRTGAWRQHSYNEGTKTWWTYFGVPHPKRIVSACYGDKAGDSQVKMALERIFQCIVNGTAIPRDMVRAAVGRVVKRAVIVSGEAYKGWYRNLLEPACSLLCNWFYFECQAKEREGYSVALDTKNKNRSYLYGRFLSVADTIERGTYSKEERDKRVTNAMKFMERFAQRPCSTWQMLYMRLLPYLHKMEKYPYYRRLIDEIGSQFREEDFVSDKPLGGEFLLGFYSQNYALEQRIATAAEKKKQKQAESEAKMKEVIDYGIVAEKD